MLFRWVRSQIQISGASFDPGNGQRSFPRHVVEFELARFSSVGDRIGRKIRMSALFRWLSQIFLHWWASVKSIGRRHRSVDLACRGMSCCMLSALISFNYAHDKKNYMDNNLVTGLLSMPIKSIKKINIEGSTISSAICGYVVRCSGV